MIITVCTWLDFMPSYSNIPPWFYPWSVRPWPWPWNVRPWPCTMRSWPWAPLALALTLLALLTSLAFCYKIVIASLTLILVTCAALHVWGHWERLMMVNIDLCVDVLQYTVYSTIVTPQYTKAPINVAYCGQTSISTRAGKNLGFLEKKFLKVFLDLTVRIRLTQNFHQGRTSYTQFTQSL